MEKIEQIFRLPAHRKILLLYHKDNELTINIVSLAKATGLSIETIRHAVNDLVDAEILNDCFKWRSRIIRIADTTQAQLVFEFIGKINNEAVVEREESFTKLELAEAENRQLNKVIDDLRGECKRRRPMKIKDALALCHRSRHYRLVYEAFQINSNSVQGMYQEYCVLCKSENTKPAKKDSMSTYIGALVKGGKIIRAVGGGYIVKEQANVIEDRSRE